MTDHDAIAAKVRQDRETGTPGPWKRGKNNPARVSREGRYIADFDPLHSKAQICENDAARAAFLPDLEEAYLDLYDEVKRLRATGEIDRKFARKTADDVFAWKSRAEKAEAERDRLLAVLDEIATAASGIARDIQIGPDDEGRDIYEMVLAIRDDARAAPEGHRDWQRDRDAQREEGTL